MPGLATSEEEANHASSCTTMVFIFQEIYLTFKFSGGGGAAGGGNEGNVE